MPTKLAHTCDSEILAELRELMRGSYAGGCFGSDGESYGRSDACGQCTLSECIMCW
ncbi:MAG: hypothetical protein QG622_1807 [Actinomycetota bacterium]|nr:hypothetical protein [Actinomycetota bacterium]